MTGTDVFTPSDRSDPAVVVRHDTADVQSNPAYVAARRNARRYFAAPSTWETLTVLFGDVEGDWRDDAACAETDPEIFYPEKGGSLSEARQVCAGCEVREQCLADALARDERFGIWGGLSTPQRQRLRRRDRPAVTTRAAA